MWIALVRPLHIIVRPKLATNWQSSIFNQRIVICLPNAYKNWSIFCSCQLIIRNKFQSLIWYSHKKEKHEFWARIIQRHLGMSCDGGSTRWRIQTDRFKNCQFIVKRIIHTSYIVILVHSGSVASVCCLFFVFRIMHIDCFATMPELY